MPVLPHIETSQLIFTANQLTGFYMRATLATVLDICGGSIRSKFENVPFSFFTLWCFQNACFIVEILFLQLFLFCFAFYFFSLFKRSCFSSWVWIIVCSISFECDAIVLIVELSTSVLKLSLFFPFFDMFVVNYALFHLLSRFHIVHYVLLTVRWYWIP